MYLREMFCDTGITSKGRCMLETRFATLSESRLKMVSAHEASCFGRARFSVDSLNPTGWPRQPLHQKLADAPHRAKTARSIFFHAAESFSTCPLSCLVCCACCSSMGCRPWLLKGKRKGSWRLRMKATVDDADDYELGKGWSSMPLGLWLARWRCVVVVSAVRFADLCGVNGPRQPPSPTVKWQQKRMATGVPK